MLKFERIYYEKEVLTYEQGKELLSIYKDIPQIEIKSHNNIEELRKYENKDFAKLKRYLILGIRKTHKYVENHKVSDYLVPYTSSGCIAMCMYCYLVCHYNKCAYLRIFVNRDEMLNKLIKKALSSTKDEVYEIGSNSDLILENLITHNLEWTIEKFAKFNKGYITFPTKFSNVDDILNLKHNGRVIVRMSVNPEYIIKNVEFLTADLKNRVKAINKLIDANYKVGIIIAPGIMVEDYRNLYKELIIYLKENLNKKAINSVFFEVIFMTYSYVHDKINTEAFPKAIKLYNKDKMRARGRYKYMYKENILEDGKQYIASLLKEYFPKNEIKYIV